MNKLHTNIDWQNYPSTDTPINEANLNKMDKSVDAIDNRVIELDALKLEKDDILKLIKAWELDETTGVITITRVDESTETYDTALEKIAVNYRFDKEKQKMYLTNEDGSETEVDLSSLISEYDFADSDTIAHSVKDGNVYADIKTGSIEDKHLKNDYLANIKVESASAASSAGAAAQSVIDAKNYADNSDEYATLSKSYAVGGTGARDGEDSDNAKYWSEKAKEAANVDIATTSTAGIVKPDGTTITVESDGTLHGVGTVTGVKGNAEGEYRKGDVNITAENIGAADGVEFDEDSSTLKLMSGNKQIDSTTIKTGGYIVFPEFNFDTATGHLTATGGAGVEFSINSAGHLESEVL